MAKKHAADADEVLERYGSHRPTPFDSHIRVEDIEDWYLVPVSHTRDSTLIEESNWETAVEMLQGGAGPVVVLEPRACKDQVVRTIHFGDDSGIQARVIRCGGSAMKVKTLLFPKERFSAVEAASWAGRHDFAWKRVEG